MNDAPDADLLEQFARNDSEAAFAVLVQRHLNLVYSTALRNTGHAHAAEEITQVVFIVLARKAGSLGRKTVLPGWLYHTARLTAANWLRAETRRIRREQEAFMQSTLEESPPEAIWAELSPHLDNAMAHLGVTDRAALVLRYFQNKSLSEVGAILGMEERAAQKRVMRALEKLRKIFSKRGVTLSAAMIAGAVSANSVQAAPVGLAATVTATAAKGVAASGSTLTLVKGALKLMAWTKAKTAVVAGVVILVTGIGTTVLMTESSGIDSQRLADGSLLVLNRLSIAETNDFVHGRAVEKLLGNSVPAKGAQFLNVKLSRPTHLTFGAPQGKTWLAAEFRLVSSNAVNHPLVKPAFYREFRCVIRGENGIEYAQEFWPRSFQAYADGCFGYVITSRFPRDSQWLWFRIERRERQDQGGPWTPVAEFKARNTTHPAVKPWVADPIHVTKTVKGMDFTLDEITVVTQAYGPKDIWNHVVATPIQISSNGVALTNWGAPYVRVEDASGNWDHNLASHRSLDPRYVWKLDADFEPILEFPPESVTTLDLPAPNSTITTNVMDQALTVSWDGYWVDVGMSTNRTDLALQFVCVTDAEGDSATEASGSWNQHGFRKGSFMIRRGGVMHMGDFKPATVTFAIVPNVHVEFLAQPKLVTQPAGD